ncbi:unnamed protein product [Urochloa decumbens]|uniref:Dirigent protein n=1 Tax=Urochloa decumbens TaxID=240449 RepID=A0ABC8VXP8_9POAL
MADACQRNEINLQGLYLHHTCLGPNANQASVINPPKMGELAVNNWTVYDGPGPNAKLVARAQGLHINAGNWHNSFSLVFENGKFNGSTLQVMGVVVERGEWAIVGGTGEFAMATGVIYKRFHEQHSDGNVMELTIKGFCPLLKGSPVTCTQYPVHKIGPWGGNGGSAQDITELPKHLESITIMSGVVIDSIKFSYIDQAGQKRTAGPWGGPGGSPHTIDLGATEFVKEMSGTFGTFDGATVITSFKLVTNVRTFGPWAEEKGTPFRVPVQSGSGIVGFFARAGKYLDAVGIHVTKSD